MYELNFDALNGEGYQRLFDGFIVTCQLGAWSLLFASCVGVVLGIVRWLNFRHLEPACTYSIGSSRLESPDSFSRPLHSPLHLVCRNTNL